LGQLQLFRSQVYSPRFPDEEFRPGNQIFYSYFTATRIECIENVGENRQINPHIYYYIDNLTTYIRDILPQAELLISGFRVRASGRLYQLPPETEAFCGPTSIGVTAVKSG
jgi:hypothetical protein